MNNLLILVLCILTFSSCSNTPEEGSQKQNTETSSITLSDEQIKNTGITVDTLHHKQLAREVVVQGRVVSLPNGTSLISFPIAIQIQTISVRLGDRVKKGQILAYGENLALIDMQENYLRTKANWEFAKEDFNRQQQLDKNNATSLKTFQQAKSTYESLTATLTSLEKQLDLIGIQATKLTPQNVSKSIAIKSDLEGVVSAITVQKGTLSTPDKPLFTIINDKETETELQVFQQDLASIQVGAEVTSEFNNQKLIGKIRTIVPTIDLNNSFTVVVDWSTTNVYPTPGTLLNVKIFNQQIKTPCVPSEAVVKWNKKEYIFLHSSKNKFNMLEVKTSVTQDNWTGIRSDEVNLDDKKIVVKGAYSILMAMMNTDEESEE
jgi:cobalt-zinc-cadmium efflux system membrane fusion protein